MFLATSDIHLKYKLRITRDQCVDQAQDAMDPVDTGRRVEIPVGVGYGTDPERVLKLIIDVAESLSRS